MGRTFSRNPFWGERMIKTYNNPETTPGLYLCRSFIDSRYGVIGVKQWIKKFEKGKLRYSLQYIYYLD